MLHPCCNYLLYVMILAIHLIPTGERDNFKQLQTICSPSGHLSYSQLPRKIHEPGRRKKLLILMHFIQPGITIYVLYLIKAVCKILSQKRTKCVPGNSSIWREKKEGKEIAMKCEKREQKKEGSFERRYRNEGHTENNSEETAQQKDKI